MAARIKVGRTIQETFVNAGRALAASWTGLIVYFVLGTAAILGLDALRTGTGMPDWLFNLMDAAMLLLVSALWAAQMLRTEMNRGGGDGRASLIADTARLYLASCGFWFVFVLVAIIAGVVASLVIGIISVGTQSELPEFDSMVEDGAVPVFRQLSDSLNSPLALALVLLVAVVFVAGLFAFYLRAIAYRAATADKARILILTPTAWTRRQTLRLLAAGLVALATPVVVVAVVMRQLNNLLAGSDAVALASVITRLAVSGFGLLLSVGLSLAVYRQVAPDRVDVDKTFG